MIKKTFILVSLLIACGFVGSVGQAQYRERPARTKSYNSTNNTKPTFTYDLGASSGTYNGNSYSEIDLGLNWNFTDFLTWRNSAFTRFGTKIDSFAGLDSSMRLNYSIDPKTGGLGLSLFAGPGYRISNQENSGLFGEAGATVRLAGLSVGLGVKAINYTSPGTNSDGSKRPAADTTLFIILAGGGAI